MPHTHARTHARRHTHTQTTTPKRMLRDRSRESPTYYTRTQYVHVAHQDSPRPSPSASPQQTLNESVRQWDDNSTINARYGFRRPTRIPGHFPPGSGRYACAVRWGSLLVRPHHHAHHGRTNRRANVAHARTHTHTHTSKHTNTNTNTNTHITHITRTHAYSRGNHPDSIVSHRQRS